MSALQEVFAPFWISIQAFLFPWIVKELGPLTEKQQQLIQILEIVRIEQFIPNFAALPGRPQKDRDALARAFVAKAVYDIPTTRALMDRLYSDVALRRICGWERVAMLPSESLFSRAFAEFAVSRLPERVHEALIKKTHQDRLVGHISRDSTAIEAREKPAKKENTPEPAPKESTTPVQQGLSLAPKESTATPVQQELSPTSLHQHPAKESQDASSETKVKRGRGRPRKGEARPKEPTRLERQSTMSLPEIIAELPTVCDVGTKKNSQGYKESWIGYKLHIDVADGQIPISCLLTSASLHDSQAAIPLAATTAERTTNLYDVMDSAYDAEEIRKYSRKLNHIPLIDVNTRGDTTRREEMEAEARRQKLVGFVTPEDLRYNERTAVERVNGRLKDEFGGRHVRVRGACKVMCHCMFGILALTADQLLRLVM